MRENGLAGLGKVPCANFWKVFLVQAPKKILEEGVIGREPTSFIFAPKA